MKIIDSHLHYCPGSPYFDEIAVRAEHINSGEHLREQYQIYEIETGVVMATGDFPLPNMIIPIFCTIASESTAIT